MLFGWKLVPEPTHQTPCRRESFSRFLSGFISRIMVVLELAPLGCDMSWDIFAMDTPPGVQSVSEIPDDFRPQSLGSRSAVITRIQQIVPTADFSDPSWGLIDGDDWSIEVNLGKDEACDGFALHVRGDEAAVGAVASILDGLGIRAIRRSNRGILCVWSVGD